MNDSKVLTCCNFINQGRLTQECVVTDLQKIVSVGSSLSSAPHTHSYYQILFISKGKGFHYIEGTNYNIERGDLFFVAPNRSHYWNFTEKTEGLFINFTKGFFKHLLSSEKIIQDLPFFQEKSQFVHINVAHNFSTISHILDKISYEANITQNSDFQLVRVYLLELLLLCKKQLEVDDTKIIRKFHPSNIVKQFERLIESRFYELKFPKEYAELLNITPNYLNAICQKIKGQSAGEMIRSRILIECKHLLVTTNLSASEVAFKLNFKDNSYFTRFFKKHIGITPDEYRRT